MNIISLGGGVLILGGLLGLRRTGQLQFFGISGWGIDLDYCDVEWFALKTNQDHSVIFKPAFKYCISDSFVDYEGYSIFFYGIPSLNSGNNGHLN